MLTILFSGGPAEWPGYQTALAAALAEQGLKARVTLDADPGAVDYVIYAPTGPVQDFAAFTRLRAVLSLWAGVERVLPNVPPEIPLTRMVDTGLREGMVEYVIGHVLRRHLGIDGHVLRQDGIWRPDDLPPLARERTVAVLGMGELGQACARALVGLNFNVLGWARRAHDLPGLTCHSGPDGLAQVLGAADHVVTLLPATPDTHHVLNAQTLAQCRPGVAIVNPGRGRLIDDDALLAALASGQVSHATLDVFHTEPLPPEHPFWAHPAVTVTPHIAAATRPRTAAQVIARNIRLDRDGQRMDYLVDRAAGY